MRRMKLLGGSEGRGWRIGGAWKTGVAPVASLDGMRHSEKVKVLERHNRILRG